MNVPVRRIRAAAVAQPAMSRALQQLRRALNDELLVRNADGYWLTPRAERIRAQLTTIVPRLYSLSLTTTSTPGKPRERTRPASAVAALARANDRSSGGAGVVVHG